MNKHNVSFFGKQVGVILDSVASSEPFIFLRFLKKKGNDEWEKPSKQEGRTIKLSIEELIMIHKVFKKELKDWKTYHSFKDEKKTPISVNWNEKNDGIWFNIEGYNKIFASPQIDYLEMLLKHIIKEKIVLATGKEIKKESEDNKGGEKETTEIMGIIQGQTDKALLIKFNLDDQDSKELWIPKSKIHTEYNEIDQENEQKFAIENWLLKKNKIEV